MDVHEPERIKKIGVGASNCFAHRFLLAFVERLEYMCGHGWRASHVAGDSNTESRRATSPLSPLRFAEATASRLSFKRDFTSTCFSGLANMQLIGRSWRGARGFISARIRFVLHGLGLNVAASRRIMFSLVLLAPWNLLPLKNVQCAGVGGQAPVLA